jgi:hypothetical protein
MLAAKMAAPDAFTVCLLAARPFVVTRNKTANGVRLDIEFVRSLLGYMRQ